MATNTTSNRLDRFGLLIVLALSAALLTAAPGSSLARAVPAAPPTATPAYDVPLGIALESYEYPYPVLFLSLQIEDHALNMAFMDVPARGESRGVVVLLHGKNFYGAYWKHTIAALSDAGYRVIVPDQIGFGKSSKPSEIHYSFDLLAQNTIALLDELKIERAAIIGHSMGGMLAVRMTRNFPQRVEKLILENPIGLEDYRFNVPSRSLDSLYDDELKQTPAKIREYFKSYFPEWKPEYEWLVEPPARVTRSAEFSRWAKVSALTYLMCYQQPVRHEFKLIDRPTLLIIGQADRTALGKASADAKTRERLGDYPALGRAARDEIPAAKLVELEGVGHIPHIQTPDQFHAALIEFLK